MRDLRRDISYMKEEYVNAFLAPAKLVWEKELKTPLDLVKAEAVSHQYTTEDITAVIGVSGSLRGNVLYGFGDGSAFKVASAMMGEPVHELDDLSLSALGEIANMITGNAATHLAAAGYECNISPPVIIEPVGSRITTTGGPQIMVTFNSELGELKIRISLTETRAD